MIALLQPLLMFVAPFIVVIGVVVTIHELGHFLAAKSVGTAIDRFSIGFGPPMARWTDRSGVEWRISWIPLGGYVKFSGDDNVASLPDPDNLADLRAALVREQGEAAVGRYFHFKPLWQRAFITAAGPASNFILSIAIFAGLLLALGQPVTPPRVEGVLAGSAAERAGFRVGDLIETVDGHAVDDFGDISTRVLLSSDTPMTFVVRRGDRDLVLRATPVRSDVVDQLGHVQRLGRLGILSPRPGAVVKHFTVPQALAAGVRMSWDRIATTVHYIGRMVTGRETADQLSGPLGMAQLSGQLAQKTVEVSPDGAALAKNLALTALELIAAISVGIGFLNLMPVPVLDGGHLLFYAYEAVARRPLAAKVQAAGYRVGLALVLGLMLFATWNDLQRLRVFNFLGGLFS